VALIGHHGPVKSRYGDIDRYYQRGQQPGLYCDRAGSNGVGTDQPVWSVQLKADTPRLVQLRQGRGGDTDRTQVGIDQWAGGWYSPPLEPAQ
jgi:hypothetical protein